MSIRLAAGATLVFFGPAIAQESTAQQNPLDNVLVTASRSPLARVNVGSSTTVISREQIELQQARYVTDLLRAVPGFSVSQSGTIGSQTQIRARGAEANHVLVLIDGIRANDPASGDEFRWEYLSTSNVERIEIVRGPQSSLWGSDAVSAVVNVVTRSGEGRDDMSLFVEGGSYDSFNGGLQAGMGRDNWSLTFGLEHLDSDGSNVSRSGSEDDGSTLSTGSVSGMYRPTAKLTLNFGLRTIDALSQYDPTDFFVTGLPADGDIATDSRQTYALLGGILDSLDGRLRHHLNVRVLDTANRSLTDGIEDSSTASDRITVSFQSDVRIQDSVLSVALEQEHTNFTQRGDASFGDPNQDQQISANSIIADFQAQPAGAFSWLLSARYDDYSDFDDALTGRLALAYAVSDATRLRGSIGSGQKVPTFIERYGFFPGQFVGNPQLKPETSTSVDLGLDHAFLDDAVSVSLTFFHQDLENEINGFVFDPVSLLVTAENMDGGSTRKGIEMEMLLRPTEGLELGGSYTYSDSTEENAQGQDVRELRRPRHSGGVHAGYRFFDDRANLLLFATYGGSQKDIFFPPFPAPSQIVTLDSYWLLGLTTSFDVSRNLNVFARVNNLLDEEYEEVFGYRTPGRAAYLGLRLHFGR